MTATTTTLTDFLLARIGDDERRAWPRTVILSGGSPAPVVPNCIGPCGDGCPDGWRLDGEIDSGPNGPHWWERPDVRAAIREHEWGHATRDQARVLAECKAKRAIVEDLSALVDYDRDKFIVSPQVENVAARTLGRLASTWADHENYRQEWAE